MDMSSHHTLDRPTITTDADGITVRVCWKPADDLDRLDAAAWGLKSSHRKLAERLVRAIEAGVVLEPDGLYTDVNGQRGHHVRSNILSRMMNADLTRLGF
jgi:hypothetical protein